MGVVLRVLGNEMDIWFGDECFG